MIPSASPLAGQHHSPETRVHPQVAEFVAFVEHSDFPCVGAKSALHGRRMHIGRYGRLADMASARQLCRDLADFSTAYPAPVSRPTSFVALFADAAHELDEAGFEAGLWHQLQAMHAVDRERFSWDPNVAADPASREFSFSIAGRAFFVVGLHPQASRLARRAPAVTLVFNFHEQFDILREAGKYQPMRDAIRRRDLALQGSLNPMLSGFGEASEARQYAGRAVAPDWTCPFHPRNLP